MKYSRLIDSVLLLERARLQGELEQIPEDNQSEEAKACQLRYQLVELDREMARRFGRTRVA